jgi:hypothetical protein
VRGSGRLCGVSPPAGRAGGGGGGMGVVPSLSPPTASHSIHSPLIDRRLCCYKGRLDWDWMVPYHSIPWPGTAGPIVLRYTPTPLSLSLSLSHTHTHKGSTKLRTVSFHGPTHVLWTGRCGPVRIFIPLDSRLYRSFVHHHQPRPSEI